MECPNCSKEVPENAKVCGYCGTKMEIKQKHTCPDCGKEVPAKAKVCGYCGTKLAALATKTTKSAPVKKTRELIVQKKTTKPLKESRAPRVKREPIKLTIPKWAFGVFAVVIVAALALIVLLPKLSRGGSGDELPFSGKWIGDVHGTNNDFTATLELDFDTHCSIGDICGSYDDINGISNGNLELVSVNNGVYKFLEHAKGKEILEGSGYQSLRLFGDSIKWSFNQGEYNSTGTFNRK